MRERVLTVTLLSSAFALAVLWAMPASAQNWAQVYETDRAAYYIDPTTIKVNGNLRRVWELTDWKKTTIGAMSFRVLSEYDCKEEKHRALSLTTFSEAMARGNSLSKHDSPDSWSYIAPGTVGYTILEIICAEKK